MAESAVALLLPGMTLNQTIFPLLPVTTISVDFSALVLGPDGSSADLQARGIGVYVDLLNQALEREPGWSAPRRIVVAHSFGGMLALAWWLANRGNPLAKVDGMVLVSTSPGPMFRAVRLLLGQTGSFELRVGIETLLRIWNRPIVTRSIKRMLTGGALDARMVDFRTLKRQSDWAVDFAGWRNTDWRAMRSFRLGLSRFDVRARLAEIDVPIIILHGTRDSLLGGDNATTLVNGLPDAELRWVTGAGHALPLTHGEAVVRAVEDVM